MTKYISAVEILRIHHKLIEDYGGSHGIRDENRLKSLENAPKQVVFGQEQYESIYQKAAVYIRNIIGDHPFADGNKRTGISVGGIFLMRNGINLNASNTELEDFAVLVATEHLSIENIAEWLRERTK